MYRINRIIKCKKCNVKFIAHNGFQVYCSECGKLKDMRYRQKNIIFIRERSSKWAREHRKYTEKSIDKKEKQIIMNKVNWAIKAGKIEKSKFCFCCGCERKLQGHHQDYSKPLDVMWLCPPCHKFLHARFDDCIKAQAGINKLRKEASKNEL